MKNVLIILSITSGFGAVALIRGISLGQDHNKYHVAILLASSFIFGLWVYILNKRNKINTDNENQ